MAPDLAKPLNDHVNTWTCPPSVRTPASGKRLATRTRTDSIQVGRLAFSWSLSPVPHPEEAVGDAEPRQRGLPARGTEILYYNNGVECAALRVAGPTGPSMSARTAFAPTGPGVTAANAGHGA